MITVRRMAILRQALALAAVAAYGWRHQGTTMALWLGVYTLWAWDLVTSWHRDGELG